MTQKHAEPANRFRQQNIVVTGGSSGIGLSIAKTFAQLGSHVFLIGRNAERLADARALLQEEYPGIKVHTFPADVSQAEEIRAVIQRIGDQYGGIHTLINNAGISARGKLKELDREDLTCAMDVNFFGAVYCTQAAWPFLARADRGHIGFVSSVAGYIGLIGQSAYSASKFAMTGLAECIRMEAADDGIGVTVIYPPDTDTPMLRRAEADGSPETRALSEKASLLAPDEVAAKLIDGIQRGRFEVFCNWQSRLIRIARALAPGAFFSRMDGVVRRARRRT